MNTWDGIGDDVPVEYIVDRVAAVADSAPDHYLRVLVITAHGQPGWIALGKGLLRVRKAGDEVVYDRATGIKIGDVPVFAKWKDRVANIWIIACNVAFKSPGAESDGNLLCCALAKTTGAYVVASTDDQVGDVVSLPWGCVDDWDGLVHRYEPEHGSVDWHHQYPSGLMADVGLTFHDPVIPPIAVPPRFRASLGGPGVFSTPTRSPLFLGRRGR